MKVSIITVSYNSAETIEDTIKSVLAQGIEDLEYVIIDGGSTDGTLEIVDRYRDKISKVISEPDSGLYDAMNKGVKECTGEIVGILNSDDVYASDTVLKSILSAFTDEVDGVYGDLKYVDRSDLTKTVRTWISGDYEEGKFRKGWMPPHPTFFVRRRCYSALGNYNLTFKSSADYDLMLRFIHKHKIRVKYVNEFITLMRVGGKSNVTLKNRLAANREDRLAWKINGLGNGWMPTLRKPLSKISQFIKK